MTTIINTHDMNTVMESGDHIIYMLGGRKRWEGSNQDIVFSEDKDLNDFIFASEFLQKAKEMTVMEEQEANPELTAFKQQFAMEEEAQRKKRRLF